LGDSKYLVGELGRGRRVDVVGCWRVGDGIERGWELESVKTGARNICSYVMNEMYSTGLTA
jgi:hypothetical protein